MNLRTALHSIVLLDNDGILPLKTNTLRRIAVIGPNADHRDSLLGNYNGTPSDAWTILRGIRETAPANIDVRYAQGSHHYLDPSASLCGKGHLLAEALEVASISDLVVLCLGLDAHMEGEQGDTGNTYTSGDKPGVELPDVQQHLLNQLLQTGKPVILVLLSGSALSPLRSGQQSSAVIQAFYPGAMGGLALAKILFGEFSPCGCLPVTFYRSTDDLPDFKDYSMKDRTYRYFTGKPLYRFGHGLSYTSFQYDELKVTRSDDGTDTIAVEVRNTGSVSSYRVLQLYMQTPGAGPDQPVEQLKGMMKIYLEPRESCVVHFAVSERDRLLFDREGNRTIAPDQVVYKLLGATLTALSPDPEV